MFHIFYAGYYIVADVCELCPAGYSCNVTHADICPAGTYSEVGQDICLNCAQGTNAKHMLPKS